MATKLELTLVGIRHHMTPATIREVASACPLRVEIEREPENIHDGNALSVTCREKPWKGMKFGYISRPVASELAPRIDAGKAGIEEAWLLSADADAGIGELQVTVRKSAKAHG